MLGQRLKDAIQASPLTFEQAAAAMQVSRSGLDKVCLKESFDVSWLRKASAVLGLPLSYFLPEMDGPPHAAVLAACQQQCQELQAQLAEARALTAPALAQELATTRRRCRELADERDQTLETLATKELIITQLRARQPRPAHALSGRPPAPKRKS
ncbi:hypothetical protein [uncultured Hymenobacter sp.]|uniref:hypothetical protein n=1 Tax=uncultured Hymenobacter sp. TaxID=170016 RepID=UPI0035CACD12